MSEFYESIIDNYDQIFPLKPLQLEFVKHSFISPGELSILDVGCGTGSLTIELARFFKKVTAIDLDEAMVSRAKQKASHPIDFRIMDMLNIEQEFGNHAFDGVICFGNTLVHLTDPQDIQDFFQRAAAVLKEHGELLFQIINYDRILDQHIKALPTVENEKVRFVRDYHYDKQTKLIDFKTTLFIKETGQEINNTVKLYPIRQQEAEGMLNKAGFKNISYFGNFKMDPLSSDSQPLIVEAIK